METKNGNLGQNPVVLSATSKYCTCYTHCLIRDWVSGKIHINPSTHFINLPATLSYMLRVFKVR